MLIYIYVSPRTLDDAYRPVSEQYDIPPPTSSYTFWELTLTLVDPNTSLQAAYNEVLSANPPPHMIFSTELSWVSTVRLISPYTRAFTSLLKGLARPPPTISDDQLLPVYATFTSP